MDFAFLLKELSMENTITVQSTPQNKLINEKIALFRQNYENFIKGLGALGKFFSEISLEEPVGQGQAMPYWLNKYLPTGDAIALCGFLVKYNPAVYIEVGSGNSTKFAKRVISHFNLRTKIISIDPYPRAEIDSLCDEVVRAPLQEVPVSVFEKMRQGSILFVDGSHRCLQNSDVTYMFLDIMPNLQPGVIFHFHDIFWPQDYPAAWLDRVYNEQYLLGVLLLFGTGYEILYSAYYASHDSQLNSLFESVLRPFLPDKCNSGGGSFWMRMNSPHVPAPGTL
jgi:hypothetical protein